MGSDTVVRKQMNPHTNFRPIRTTFMELIQEVSKLTKDDNLVIAAVRSIFDTYNVRLAHSLAPVRLVVPQMRNKSSSANFGSTKS